MGEGAPRLHFCEKENQFKIEVVVAAHFKYTGLDEEICRENRCLQNELKELEELVGSIENIKSRISGQEEIAMRFIHEMFKEKSEIYSKNKDIIRQNKILEKELRTEREKGKALEEGVNKLIQHVEGMGDRSPPREKNDNAEKILDETLEEKSGDIHQRIDVIVSDFCTDAFTIVGCYTPLCGMSLLCGMRNFFLGLVGGAATALAWSCYYALHRINKNGKRLHEVEHEQNQLSLEPSSDAHSRGEPSTWLILRFVWRDLLQVIVFAIMVTLYLLHLALHLHKEKCSTKLSSLMFSILGREVSYS